MTPSAMDLGRLVGGGALLYLGAEWLVGGAAGLARRLGVPQLLIGLTVVAYGTSAPELIVGVQASWTGLGALALGNVMGSNLANLGLILGLAVLIRPTPVEGGLARRELPMLLLSTAALWAVLVDGEVSRREAWVLVLGAVGYTLAMVRGHLSREEIEEAREEAAEVEEAAEAAGAPADGSAVRLGFIAVAGLLLLLAGGHLFVGGAEGLARTFGLSDRLIGLTVVAVGTSVPELAASIVAALRGHSGIAIGNVVGSNIFNVLLCLGGAGLAAPIRTGGGLPWLELCVLTGLTVAAVVFLRARRTCRRAEGLFLLVAYVAFLALLAGWR
jgi:cation:H+ antiporter